MLKKVSFINKNYLYFRYYKNHNIRVTKIDFKSNH